MEGDSHMDSKTFSLDELCRLTGYPKRTVRYYIQLGLVSRPVGEVRAARYSEEHLGQLHKIRELSTAGVSLGGIREVLAGREPPVPPRQRMPGTMEIRKHIHVAPGMEFQIAPEGARLTPEQTRALVTEVIKLADAAQAPDDTES